MTRRDALTELRDKVRVGEFLTGPYSPSQKAFGQSNTRRAHSAYHGSLDAAKALHDAVLPGWTVNSLHQNRKPDNGMPANGTWSCLLFRYDPAIAHVETKANTPARAWLLAIIEALISEADE